ncbi:MAG: hypothetical protein ACLVF7_02850 [Ruminococcus sp.]|nr:hypothetical protein [uncultured Ruminococcus sp.]
MYNELGQFVQGVFGGPADAVLQQRLWDSQNVSAGSQYRQTSHEVEQI